VLGYTKVAGLGQRVRSRDIAGGLECKALRRTSCVQAWLSFLMHNVFYFWSAMALPGDDLSVLKI